MDKKRKHSGTGSDSGSDIGRSKKKVAKEDSESEADQIGAEDVFGDDLSISSEDEVDVAAKKKVIDEDDEEREVERYDEGADEDKDERRSDDDEDSRDKKVEREDTKKVEDEEQVPETRIDVEVPKIKTDIGKELHFVKLPNFLSVDSRPYDQEMYEDEMDEETMQDEEGRARLKLKVENTIRWRQGTDKETGQPRMETNTRIVRWSDGSLSLHLGSEIFDVHKQPLQSDFNHLFIRQGTGLQGQAVFRTKLSFRPHSTDSQTHKKMTLSMADRSGKSSTIKVISQVGVDPEAGRWSRMKAEEGKLRESLRKDAIKKRAREKGASKGITSGYLEDDDSDNDAAFSIRQIKEKYGKKVPEKKKPIYSSNSGSDSDDSEDDRKKAKKLEKSKASRSSSGSRSSSASRSGSSRSRSG